jgi:NAD(P)-dependent dehydrogenase (short-subunit alcohol dehydrogenase family)
MSHSAFVLVTGSSRGLGKGVALELARAGHSVAIHYASNRSAAEETAAICQGVAVGNEQIFPVVGGNLGDGAGRSAVFEGVLSAFGGRLDALVNNAGMAPRQRLDVTEATESSFDEIISVNLKGPYFLTQLAARHWLDHPGQGRLPSGYKLVWVTSISASTASVNRGDYCISKAGLAMANLLWAARLAAEGIVSIELRPGIMATDMTAGVKEKYDAILSEGKTVPQARWGRPEDVAVAVRSILDGHFDFSTGTTIDLDGGFQIRRL